MPKYHERTRFNYTAVTRFLAAVVIGGQYFDARIMRNWRCPVIQHQAPRNAQSRGLGKTSVKKLPVQPFSNTEDLLRWIFQICDYVGGLRTEQSHSRQCIGLSTCKVTGSGNVLLSVKLWLGCSYTMNNSDWTPFALLTKSRVVGR